MPRHRTVRPTMQPQPSGGASSQRFSSPQLMGIAAVVFAVFIGVSIMLSMRQQLVLIPDTGYAMPAKWPIAALWPPAGAQPGSSQEFLRKSPVGLGDSLELNDNGVMRTGVCFSHAAKPAELKKYIGEVLAPLDYNEVMAGNNPPEVIAVWNSKFGNISVILREVDGQYELLANEQ